MPEDFSQKFDREPVNGRDVLCMVVGMDEAPFA